MREQDDETQTNLGAQPDEDEPTDHALDDEAHRRCRLEVLAR
jgi:hypothetical protein